jgi:hypothetical protein
MQITVTDTQKCLEIPAGTRLVEIANTGSQACYRGWEPETSAAGATQGLPIAAGAQVIYNDVPLSAKVLRLQCATGLSTTINYSFSQ